MNDRLKFCAMTIEGFWVYGFLSIIEKTMESASVKAGYYISNAGGYPFAYEVKPETVGQCTGRKDKNGKLIFEGDVLKSIWSDRVDCAFTREPKIHFFLVFYNGAYLTLREEENKIPHVMWKSEDYEIIGNVHQMEATK